MFEEFTGIMVESATQVGPYLISFLIGVQVGSLTPTYYAAERMRGFGRAMFEKLPYKAPPGMDKEEALREATTEDAKLDEESKEE